MFASHAFLPATSDIPLTLGRKNRIGCFGGIKNLDFEMKGADQSPPRGTQATTGRGRERELRERDGSHKRSRNYSRKLRERTPLPYAGGRIKFARRKSLLILRTLRIRILRELFKVKPVISSNG